jgi:hypothetical protein
MKGPEISRSTKDSRLPGTGTTFLPGGERGRGLGTIRPSPERFDYQIVALLPMA